MNKPITNFRSGQAPALQSIFGWMMLFLLWALPSSMKATHVDNTWNYTVMYSPPETIELKLALYDCDGADCWVTDGNVYVEVEGESTKKTLLHYKAETDIDNDHNYNRAKFSTGVDGKVQIVRGIDHGDEVVGKSETGITIYRPNTRQEYFDVNVKWFLPLEYRGKKIKISFKVQRHGNARSNQSVDGIPSQEFNISQLDALVIPDIMTPMLAYEKANAGNIMVPWMIATSKVKKVTMRYQDENQRNQSLELDTVTSGFVYLPFDKIVRQCYVEVTYLDTEKKTRVSKSAPIDIPILHIAKNFKAALNTDGTATLTWETDRPGYKDIMYSDLWEIQRCIGPDVNESKWQNIGQVSYDNESSQYSYKDEMLFNSYQTDSIYYRVRRASTALWGWSYTVGAVKANLHEQFFLPYFENAKVTKDDDWGINDKHSVTISWDVKNSPMKPYDIEGNYIIRSREDWCKFAQLVNEGGETSLNAVMYADVNLGDRQDMVGTSEHPYRGHFDGNGHTLTFKYEFDVNKNVSDRSIDNHPIAPFSYAGDKVKIENLHTKGSISTNAKFAGGIIGFVKSESVPGSNQVLTMEKCRSSVTINSTLTGDGTHGGLVGVVRSEGVVKITMTDCHFDGEFIGKNTHSWGGFVGFAYYPDLTMTNCLFDPKTVDCNTYDSNNIIRKRSFTNYHLKEVYYIGSPLPIGEGKSFPKDGNFNNMIKNMGDIWVISGGRAVLSLSSVDYEKDAEYTSDGRFILRTDKDWVKFCELVNGGQTKLNAIMASNINLGEIQSSVGFGDKLDDNGTYEGDFNGNGYTLTIGFVDDTQAYTCAPFAKIGANARIHDLHVKGSVTSNARVNASVVAVIRGDAKLENIISDVSVTCFFPENTLESDVGGLVGVVVWRSADNRDANVSLTNCAFYGSLERDGVKGNFGGIVGFQYNYTTLSLSNVLFAPKNIKTNVGEHQSNAFLNKHGQAQSSFNRCFYSYTALPYPDGTLAASTLSPGTLANALGSAWSVVDDRAVPTKAIANSMDEATSDIAIWDERAKVMLHANMIASSGEIVHTFEREVTKDEINAHQLSQQLVNTCVDYEFYLTIERDQSPLYIGLRSRNDAYNVNVIKTETGEDTNYEFNLNGKVTGLTTEEQQSSVILSWTTNNLLVDFYRVLRQDLTDTTGKVDTLVANYMQTQYTDVTPQPQHTYKYRVEAIVDCEGQHLSFAEATGHCASTGMIRGYVRLSDGTAIAGATVVAKPSPSSNIKDGKEGTAVTDENGFFEIPGLIYQTKGSYVITVTRKGNEGTFESQSVEFNEYKNLFNNVVFYMDEYCTYAGKVMYDGSSIPVLGAQFKIDGQIITKSSGPDKGKPVTTNNAGEFSLSIPRGPHKVQVVKAGHVFENQGYIINHNAREDEDSTDYNFQSNIYEHYLWDQTRVTLRGRVVGGNDQGSKPLGRSISVNNLGDSIRIVMELEGDNSSWIVRDQRDETIHSRDSLYSHGVNDTTRVVSKRYSITISVDNKSGEYQAPFYPVKYKVTDIYCKGYATLFEAGKVGETLDLSNCVQGDTIVFNRIYHKPATLAYEQFTGTADSYYGLKEYMAQDNLGNDVKVQLWKDGKYSFGYPVFMSDNPTLLTLSAREEYYYNNLMKDQPDDIVLLNGGTVYVHNGLISAEHTDSVKLNEEGKASYLFTPQNLTFTQEGDNALKSLTFTLLYDDTYYDIKPLQGFVLASQAKPQGKRAVASGVPHLIDILRDPPGGESSAYIESGSKLKYGFQFDLKIEAGADITLKQGQGADYYKGIWAGEGSGTAAGNLNSTESNQLFNMGFLIGYHGAWNYSYEFETTQKIETASGIKSVGAVADLYIGMTDETVIEDAIAVRVVPESMYKLLVPATGNTFERGGREFKVDLGTVKVLAEGEDADGKKVYLIRDEVLKASPRFKTTFVHSEGYIEKELLPQLLRMRESLMLPKGTTDEEAQAMANRLKHPVYVSKVPTTDPRYTLTNDKGEYNYVQFVPSGTNAVWPDSIASLNNEMEAWIGFLAINEQEKLNVSESDKIKTFSFDGSARVEYGESFNYGVEKERYMKVPFMDTPVTILGDDFFGALTKDLNGKGEAGDNEPKKDENTNEVSFKVGGNTLKLVFKPILTFELNQNNTTGEEHSKKTGFTFACDRQSYLTVDVYRTRVDMNEYLHKIETGDMDVIYRYSEQVKNEIISGMPSFMPYNVKSYSNFVFRTRGGATKKPYEDERLTEYYNVGQVLDVKTVPIDNPRIWTDQATVSNVPYGEPARFIVHLSNESEVPNFTSPVFKLCRLDNEENNKGAKIYVDGVPLTPEGISVLLDANTVVDKLVEVYAGTEFDYDNLTLSFWDPEDPDRSWKQNISAHFLPSAGKINIDSPDDKWVLNTESPYDKDKQCYYMPIRINGFDVNARGFDHIELQYKLSTEGDKSWVNVCSYYKSDSLMALASGERKLIKNDGYIDDAIFYGEKDPVEQYYDIRAVVYCRHAGGFITSDSRVISGVKDTRIPVPFGTPKPVNGILDIGDDIIISFSEPIAGNYLTEVNNFEVLGTTNTTSIALSTALRFSGNSVAFTQADRNLSGKSFAFDMMLNPDHNGKAMTVLTHGNYLNYMTLGLTADRRLTATLEGLTATSDKAIDFKGLNQVVYSFEFTDDMKTIVRFYDGSTLIGQQKLDCVYQGYGNIFVGGNVFDDPEEDTGNAEDTPDNYQGTMLEMRLWNTPLSESFISKYSQKVLTGYELHLIDNYAMNEGSGIYCYDKAVGGNDLILSGTSWVVPDGISLKLDGEKGVKLASKFFNRQEFEDYTLMFWFRTDELDGTLMANGLGKDEPNNANHINIGLDNGTLFFRSAGMEVSTNTYINDGIWHHFAMTINRSRNVGNIYIDQALKATFPTESLGGFSGEDLAVGATYTDTETATAPLVGNIDEIAMYEMVLPPSLIDTYAKSTPSGTEMGTMVYLPFSSSTKLKDNHIQLVPSGISLRRYKEGRTISETRCDTIVEPSVAYAMADKENYARMREKTNLEHLEFSYVVDDQDLLLNLDVPDAEIEKTNVYITVKEVADLNGNLTASPVLLNLYVYRNPLRWDVKRLNVTTQYGNDTTVEVKLKNLDGRKQSYTMEGLPIWITASKSAGVIDALDEETITLTISPYINIGDYDEKIYVKSENGMSEPLPINITVRGEEPDWVVSDVLKERNISMNMVARVYLDDHLSSDPDDMLAVFGEGHKLLGVAHIDVDQTANANEALAFVNIYNMDDKPTKLSFEFFNASTGKIHVLEPDERIYPDGIKFKANTILGTSANPVMLYEYFEEVQTLRLKKGWNWLSFYVMPEKQTVSDLLYDGAEWVVGDGFEVITSQGKPYQYSFKSKPSDDPNKRIYFWDHGNDSISIDPSLMYRFHSMNDKTAYLAGLQWFAGVTVKHGWNRVGFVSPINLPLSVALSDYTDFASDGDIIKSQDEFAVLNVIGENRIWKGTLKYLSTGSGYMIKRNATDERTFFYPLYGSSSRYSGTKTPTRAAAAPLYENNTASNMNVIAVPEGVELQEGDRLVAYHGADVCGIAEADEDGLFFLTVGEPTNSAATDVQFTIERDGETVAFTSQTMKYAADAMHGTIEEPTVIRFIESDRFADGEWYTLQGIRLPGRPADKGVYIFNGNKVLVK